MRRSKLSWLSLLLVLSVVSTLLAGCTEKEMALVSSFERLMNAKSYEQSSHISFELEFSGGDEVFKEAMQKAKHVVDNLSFDTISAYEGDVSKGKMKASAKSSVAIDPLVVSGEVWVDVDLNSSPAKYQTIVKVPDLVKAFVPSEYAKEYLSIDLMRFGELAGDSYTDFVVSQTDTEIMLGATQMILEVMSELKQTRELFNDLMTVSKLDNGNTKLTLSMTDGQLKNLLVTFLKELMSSDKLLDEFIELAMTYTMPESTYEENASIQHNLQIKQELVSELTKYMPIIETFLADNSILGDKGLLYEVELAKDDSIVSENLLMSFSINTDTFFPYYSSDESNGTVVFTIKSKSEYASFNKGTTVNMPVLTSENSADFVDITKKFIAEQQEEQKYQFPYSYYSYYNIYGLDEESVSLPMKGKLPNGNTVDTNISLSRYDYYGYYAPLRDLANIFGGSIEWNEEGKYADWSIGDKTMCIYTQDSKIYDYIYDELDVDDIAYDYDYSYYDGYYAYGNIVDGVMHISLSDIEYFIDVDLGFDNETQTILVR